MMRIRLPQTFITLLLLVILSFSIRTPVDAEEMTCPEHTPVMVDVKPGSDPNSINLSSKGLLAVAVLSSPDFNASLFSAEIAHLVDEAHHVEGSCQGAHAVRWESEDVNKDGRPDLVFFFRVQELGFTSNTTAVTFMAHGMYVDSVIHIIGTDSVRAISK